MSKQTRIEATTQGFALGWSYVPLSGKRPTQTDWAARGRETRDQAIQWAAKGNVGIRTGRSSGGLVAIDIDSGADVSAFDFPDTITVKTGNSGMHLYYKHDGDLKNSAGKLAPKIDVRANGGQVVAVGSVHDKTKKVYHYAHGLSPDDVGVASLPRWIALKLTQRAKNGTKQGKNTPHEGKNTRSGAAKRPIVMGDGISPYARAALDYEAQAVRQAPEGERNDTLNRAAFAVGTLIGAGELDRAEAEAALEASAMAAGLAEAETRVTLASGVASGMESPRDTSSAGEEKTRTGPSSGRGAKTPPPPIPASGAPLPSVLVPGVHVTTVGYKEVSNSAFVNNVLRALPDSAIYRRGGIPVEIVGDRGRRKLQVLTVDRMRIVMDERMRLVHWARKKNAASQSYKNASRDWARLVLAAASDSPQVREIELFTNYPIYGRDWELARPGWHAGTYYDQPPELAGMSPRAGWAVIEDLLVDFPFASEADRENFVSLLLTPMVRPALLGNVPMFLIKSSLPRTGKTKLAEQVVGGTYLGEETPAMQWSNNEDERDKRILSVLKQGDTILHIDNVSAYLDSPALASLITSKYYQGRILGQSQMMRVENTLTLIATANNPRATREIVRRSIPITLQPETDAPELRDDFKHKRLFRHVLNQRPRIWSAMIAMVEEWKRADAPEAEGRMGGFEGWVSAMSGIMAMAGADKWMSNWRDWVRQADPEGEDLKELVEAWWDRLAGASVHAKEVLAIAEDRDLFGMILQRARTPQGRLTAFATGVLVKYLDAPVESYIIRRDSGRAYRLDRMKG